MIKRIFIMLFLTIFFVNIAFANGTVPYTNNTEVKFNDIVGTKITSDIHGYNYNNVISFCIDGEYVYHIGDGNYGGLKYKTHMYTKETQEVTDFPCIEGWGYNYDGRLGSKNYNGDIFIAKSDHSGLYKNSISPENLIVSNVFAFDINIS